MNEQEKQELKRRGAELRKKAMAGVAIKPLDPAAVEQVRRMTEATSPGKRCLDC